MASAEGTSHALIKVVENLSKGQGVGQETELLMKSYVNLEEFLTPVPITIALLGRLICISNVQEHFPINTSPPAGGFQYLEKTDSFSASLRQVNNACWEAFNKAEENMKGIEIRVDAILSEMKKTVPSLFQEGEPSIACVPEKLQSIHKITEKCGEVANTVRDEFTEVINLIRELLEACCSAKQHHEKEQVEAQRALQQAKIQEIILSAKKEKEDAEQHYQKMKELNKESFQQALDALKSIPTGWEAVGMELVTMVTQTLGTLSAVFGKNRAEISVCTKSSELLTFATSLKNLLDDNGDFKTAMILDEKTGEVKTEWVKNNLKKLRNIIEKEEGCEPKVKAQEICQAGLDICQQLGKMASSEGGIGKAERSLADRIHLLYQKASEFDSYSKKYTLSPAFALKLPNVSKMWKETQVGEDDPLLKARQRGNDSQIIWEQYRNSIELLKEKEEKLTEIQSIIQDYQVEKVDFATAISMLTELLKVLGNIKEQWEKMARFFQMISNLIEPCLVWSRKGFADTVDDTRRTSRYSSKAFIEDVAYAYLFNVSFMARLVAIISEIYTEVSEEYLTNCKSNLDRLFGMRGDPGFAAELNTLDKRCVEAQKAMQEKLSRKAAEFESQLEAQAKVAEREKKAVKAGNGDAEPHLKKLSLG